MSSADTIVAAATPYGFGGISVVRMSGADSKTIIESLSLSKKQKPVFQHKIVTLVRLLDSNRIPFEEGLVIYFKEPFSYTGENVVEISCHGNPSIVNKIISVCCDSGARLAEPGEFTKRAFLNGKLDLIQAESVASLIQSKTDDGASLNFKMLDGDLSKTMEEFKDSLVSLLSKIEFELDVNEEDLQPNLKKETLKFLNSCESLLNKAASNHNSYRMLNEGASVVICGRPNVGKSTLLNLLSGSDRAITSPHPGTTRDTIESSIFLGGYPVKLIDTAGFRSSNDEIEKEGILRTEQNILKADCVLVLTSIDSELKPPPFLCENNNMIHVINKSDLSTPASLGLFKNKYPDACILSAKSSDGIENLYRVIKNKLGRAPSLCSSVPLVTSRQNQIVKNILRCLCSAKGLISSSDNTPYELIAFELHDALKYLDLILGKTITDDILDRVFNDFCVGK